jgi:hypothetical protein
MPRREIMKYLKMLGLAVISAAALMAFGAGSASATTLYSTGAPISAGTTVHATMESGTVTTSTTDGKTLVDTCTINTINGRTTNTSGSTVTVAMESIQSQGCTVLTQILALGTLHIDSAGAITGSGSTTTINFGGVSCRYGYGSGTYLGSLGTSTFLMNAVLIEQEPKSFICPDTTKWSGAYVFTSPHDLTAGA